MRNREKLLFNDDWKFTKKEIGTTLDEINSSDIIWNDVELPHDWLIYDTENLYESSDGWYKKKFIYTNYNEDNITCLNFDGVYMNSTVYINNVEVGTWHYGYSSFEYDITKYLKEGENTILVQVRHEAPNSRWYSGAGIYRNVWLKKVNPIHIADGGIYVTTDGAGGNVTIQTEIKNKSISKKYNQTNTNQGKKIVVKQVLLNQMDEVVQESLETILIQNESGICNQKLKVDNPILWDLDTCYLYTLKTILLFDGENIDEEVTQIGFRTFTFDPNEGFTLNGVYMKLRGVCMHHDLGSLGAAMNKVALERQLRIMKEMGANAIRTSHNMPAKEVMEICDKIGLLVNSEAFDIWELPKTKYDYARFFNESSEKDIESWVRRDRNHPSVIMWSIGNEIHDTHASERGLEIAKLLKSYVLQHDPNQNAVVTIGSNYIAWENAQRVAEELTYSGYNYAEYLYDDHHKKYPHWIIYGSETTSTVKSRGIYHFPAGTPILTHDDMQCSSLDNSVVGWGGKNAEHPWIIDRDRKYIAGQFIWTGFDYIGEPTPYSTKNSYYGLVDTAGIPKDVYFMYQAEWTDYKTNPMVHLLPYWDFNLGQVIDVIAYTNAPKVELFVNGNSRGIQFIDHKNGQILHSIWKVAYEPGMIEVKAYDEEGNTIATARETSFSNPTDICLKPDRNEILATGKDLCFVEISTVDAQGNYVANARNRIEVEVIGAGRLIGLDNGDSTDYDSYKGTSRKLFSGKLMAIIESKLEPGDINITVSSKDLKEAKIVVHSLQTDENQGISNYKDEIVVGKSFYEENKKSKYKDEMPVRKIELIRNDKNHSVTILKQNKEKSADLDKVGNDLSLENNIKMQNELTKENPTAIVQAKIMPATASYKELTWKMVNNNGVETNIASMDVNENEVTVTAISDGAFRLRCMCKNGGEIPQIISELEFSITGLGNAIRSPYQFTSACTFNLSNVPLNIVKEGAISGFHERTYIGYQNIDFGKTGTDTLSLYIGNSGNDPVPVQIWEGMPDDKDAEMITKVMFDFNGEWDGFKPCEYKLQKPLTGLKTISFVIENKIIFGGFEFMKIEKAFEKLNAIQYDQIYGDTYQIMDHTIENIGNNVVLEFHDMDFGEIGARKVMICGKTPNKNNTVHIRFVDENQNAVNQIIEFPYSENYQEIEFELEEVVGLQKVSFVYLPGSNFDFDWFQFK